MTRFIGYAVDGYDTDLNAPVSTGETREEAQGLAITRVLSIGMVETTIQVQDRTKDVSEEDFLALQEHLKRYFGEKGIE